MHTLYVGGLKASTSADELRRLFSDYGPVERARIVQDDGSQVCRGFGYVTFKAGAAARAARKALDGRDVAGQVLRVEHTS